MFTYTNLNLNCREKHIRICTLLPGTGKQPIHCHLSVHDLDQCNDFDALSYAWGDRNNCSNITIDGEDFLITGNLSTALRQLRNPLAPRRLWIDAICINQDNTDERSDQVSIMGLIYKSAACVISWMGFRDPNFDLVEEMQYAQNFLRHITFLRSHDPFREYLAKGGACSKYADFDDHVTWFNIGLWSFQFLIGERKEQPEYWQRAWITQEVVRSRRWILQVGDQTISDEEIESVGYFLQLPSIYLIMERRYQERVLRATVRKTCFAPISVYRCLLREVREQDNVNGPPPSGSVCLQFQARLKAKASGPWPLLQLLRYNQSRVCQDARDKVYSILGISDLANLQHPGLVVDYTRSITDIYKGTVQAIVETSSSLDILSSVRLDPGLCELPSWVPDWNSKRTAEEADRPVSYASQSVCSINLSNFPPQFWTCPNRNCTVLTVWGVQLGKIAEIKETIVRIPAKRPVQVGKKHTPPALSVYKQLPGTYKWASNGMAPATLSPETFLRTCAMGLLEHSLDDGFPDIMDSLVQYIKLSDASNLEEVAFDCPYRSRTMASALDGKCLFTFTTFEPDKKRLSSRHSISSPLEIDNIKKMIGIAPSRVVCQGDVVSFLPGCSTPILLRQTNVEGLRSWKVVSPAYIDSFVNLVNTYGDRLLWCGGDLEKFDLI